MFKLFENNINSLENRFNVKHHLEFSYGDLWYMQNGLIESNINLIRSKTPEIAVKIDTGIEWLFSRPWSQKIDFIIFYGSVALGHFRPDSDIDLVIGIQGSQENLISINKEIALSGPFDDLDIRIFENLPVYIQKDALRGIILFCKDFTYLSDLAYKTIKNYDAFRPYLDDYTGAVPLS
ncbi:hypothetical protein DLD82_00090 [Methanospirillum stamsii]|uniref:Polymerase beta nucleotidyltransferase domain-containing protein n=2 Tax=Methanospirillum stamsii TaxID=1277351 RepID=A0A2V2NIS1_9EURY|nr:hypothetical protein DLD82_00090 [Methanospirillum stamsii]